MSKRAIHPLNDYVLVQRDAAKERTESGLYIPDNAKEKVNIGIVQAVGRGKALESGKLREPSSTLVKGAKVIFGKYAGQEFELDGEKGLLLLREDEILGVLVEFDESGKRVT